MSGKEPIYRRASKCYGTKTAVCPYCGREKDESWCHTSDSGITQCMNCGETFSYQRYTSTYYDTQPLGGWFDRGQCPDYERKEEA